ncbi:MAG: formylmethanofuran dehydrogenase subunit C [Alphaproteobacteria bacterium]|nr:formylmethanofuran dehydrogenase subunit C [Alphaproteobacteria bacterium]
MRFTLRAPPEQRVDCSPLTPERIAGLDVKAIERLAVNTTRAALCVGDVFRVRAGNAERIAMEGGSARFDYLGHGMTRGELVVEGDAGFAAGRTLAGGRVQIRGNAGPFAASGMRAGKIAIAGDAGERLGGPLAGERLGMSGGVVVVGGNAGERAGDRLRRGLIVIEGAAGRAPASRMIAGTVVVCGAAGALPGYLMRRGTLVLGEAPGPLPPTFSPVGGEGLVFLRLLARTLLPISPRAARLLRGPMRRFAGDMAVLGKGEMVVAEL